MPGEAVKMAEETARIPANLMRLLEQSYGTRERQLDWLLAIVAVGVTTYTFWPQLKAIFRAPPDMKPNDDVKGATPDDPSVVYMTYNQPPTRVGIAARRGPSATAVPMRPGATPNFSGAPTMFDNQQA